jgi:Rps23 Pro-64 3,4-dihydroxylase Tpa1-like proline 4-hydroxylase
MDKDYTGSESRVKVVDLAPSFPYFRSSEFLDEKTADAILAWFTEEAPWKLRIASFYKQYECSLLSIDVPRAIRTFVEDIFVDRVRTELVSHLGAAGPLKLIDIAAHHLVPNQTIRIHNDYVGGEETHRFLIQVNNGWSVDNGGLLMLFASDRPDDVEAVIQPTHRSGFGFRICKTSFHAVSTVRKGDRFTLVYTFRESPTC